MNRILVIGRTGNVGRQVVDQLAATGARFRAMTRNLEAVGLPAQVEVVLYAHFDSKDELVARLHRLANFYVAGTRGDAPGAEIVAGSQAPPRRHARYDARRSRKR